MSQLIIVSGPSGVGKNTLVDVISSRFPHIKYFKKDTTRTKRPDDRDAEANFLSQEEFDAKKAKFGIALEYRVRGKDYGLPMDSFAELKEEPRVICLSDFELIKALQNSFDTITMYIKAEEKDIIQRLKDRKDTEEQRAKSIKSVAKHLQAYKNYKELFDYEIINGDNLDVSYFQMMKIMHNEVEEKILNYNISINLPKRTSSPLITQAIDSVLNKHNIAKLLEGGRNFETSNGGIAHELVGDGVIIRTVRYPIEEDRIYKARVSIRGLRRKILKASYAMEENIPELKKFAGAIK